MKRQSIISVLVIAMMFVIPLVPIAYYSGSSLASDGLQQELNNGKDEGQSVTESVPEKGIQFYKDNLGVIWLFDIDSNNHATIKGSFFGYCSNCEDGVLTVPSAVEYNLKLNAPVVENNIATLSFSEVDPGETFVVSTIANGAVSTTDGQFMVQSESYTPSAPHINMLKYYIMYGIKLSNSIKQISFDNCSAENRSCFTELVIPSSVKSIGSYAFNELPNITKISFAADSILETIQNNAFNVGVKPTDTSSMIVMSEGQNRLSDSDFDVIRNTAAGGIVTVVINNTLTITKDDLSKLGYDLYDLDGNIIDVSDSCTFGSSGNYAMMNTTGEIIWFNICMPEDLSISKGVVVTIPDTVIAIEKKCIP